MAIEQGWYYEWFANNWFPPVWFAPSDEEDVPLEERRPTGGGTDSHVPVNLHEAHKLTKERNEERFRLEAERLAEIEREASEVLARIARANEPEPSEPVVIPIPEAIEPTVKESFTVQFSPVNDLVATNDLLINEQISSISYADTPKHIQEMAKSIHDDNDTIALLLILAEID